MPHTFVNIRPPMINGLNTDRNESTDAGSKLKGNTVSVFILIKLDQFCLSVTWPFLGPIFFKFKNNVNYTTKHENIKNYQIISGRDLNFLCSTMSLPGKVLIQEIFYFYFRVRCHLPCRYVISCTADQV